ncbi:BACON domain-containing protein [uncultured Draconibacterium sp.]|uniref:BACON domain-containing protein n=1 Tax=uncultured Draconibacterium sp. TaxID=1573823 RepID=UPI0032180064
MKKFYILLTAVICFVTAGAQTHFQPAWDGNGQDHMNIYITAAIVEGVPLEAGDEIAAFDGDICTGVFVLTEPLIDSTLGMIVASKADSIGAGNGYEVGNTISFKFWDASEQTEYSDVLSTFVDNDSGSTLDPVPYTESGTAFVELEVDLPCVFEVDPTTFLLDSVQTSIAVGITSYNDWSVLSSPDWITPYRTSGSGTDSLGFLVSANHGTDRSGVVELEGCDGITANIEVVQDGPEACEISLNKSVLDIPQDGYTGLVKVYCNSEWVVTDYPDWVTLNKESGEGTMWLQVSIGANAGVYRSGTITVSTCDDAAATLLVNQVGQQACEVSFSPISIDESYEGTVASVDVLSNSTWQVLEYSSWLTLDKEEGTGDALLNITIDENTGVSRSGFIIVGACDAVTDTLIINQQGLIPCEISLNKSVLDLPSEGYTGLVKVYCNSEWVVTDYPDWVTLNKESGEGTMWLQVSIGANAGVYRSGTITVSTCDDAAATLLVNQVGQQACEVSFSPISIDESYEGTVASVDVLSNSTWQVLEYSSWLTLDKEEGTGDALLNITIDENTGVSRSGFIIVGACDAVTDTLIINQQGLIPCEISLNKSVLDIPQDGYTGLVKVYCNSEWVVTDYPDWVTLNKESGEGTMWLQVSIGANAGVYRSGTITVSTCDDAAATLLVNQVGQQACEVSFSPISIDESYEGTVASVDVLSNSTWQVLEYSSWLTLDKEEGTGDALLNITIDENTGVSRSGFIIVGACDAVTDTLIINQQGLIPCEISLNKSVLDLPSEGYTGLVKVYCNSEWVVTDYPDWVTLNKESGEGTMWLQVSIGANAGVYRSGTITVSTCDDAAATLLVNQVGQQACEVSFSPISIDESYEGTVASVDVLSNSTWQVLEYSSWLTLDKEEGTGDALLNITIDENTGVSRSGFIIVGACDAVTDTLIINQQGLIPCEISLNKSVLDLPSEGYTGLVKVYCNSEWVVTDYPDWVTLNKESGVDTMWIQVSIGENTGGNISGEVTFTTCENATAVLIINQSGLIPCEISLNKSVLDLPSEGCTGLVKVYCNSEWVVTDYPDWVTLNKESGVDTMWIRVTLGVNSGVYRSGVVTFSTCDDATVSLTINQLGIDAKSTQVVTSQELISFDNQLIKSKMYPNPFSRELKIDLNKYKGEKVSLRIYDIQGRIIRNMDIELSEGLNSILWDAKDGNGRKVQSGMYLIQLQSDLRRENFKVVFQGE